MSLWRPILAFACGVCLFDGARKKTTGITEFAADQAPVPDSPIVGDAADWGPTKGVCPCTKAPLPSLEPGTDWTGKVWFLPPPRGFCDVPEDQRETWDGGCAWYGGEWAPRGALIRRQMASSTLSTCGDRCNIIEISPQAEQARYDRLNSYPPVTGYHRTEESVCKSIIGEGGFMWLGAPGEAGSAIYFGHRVEELNMKTFPKENPCTLKCSILLGNAKEVNVIKPRCGQNFSGQLAAHYYVDGTVIDNPCSGWEFVVYFVDQVLECMAYKGRDLTGELIGHKVWSTLPLRAPAPANSSNGTSANSSNGTSSGTGVGSNGPIQITGRFEMNVTLPQ